MKSVNLDYRSDNIEVKTGGSSVETILKEFQTISLGDLGETLLQKRFDTKFVVPENFLMKLLPALVNEMDILEIDGLREFNYLTQYYDTRDYHFYYKHHNGGKNRKKLRYRKYVDSGISFLEVKHKINGSFIKKTRIPAEFSDKGFNAEGEKFILSDFGMPPEQLIPKLKTRFKRITLKHKFTEEKVTIDRDVYFKNTMSDSYLTSLSIIEVKQTRKDNTSGMIKLLREAANLHPVSFSKYCIGLVMTDCNVKYNNFKTTLLYLQKIHEAYNGN